MNLFNLVSKLDKRPIDEAKMELKRRMELPTAQFLENTKKMAWEVFQHHYAKNQHYRDFVGKAIPSNWQDIPILTKNAIQIPLEQRLTEGYNGKNSYFNNTSGSTGKPFFFAKDKFAHAMTWALILDRFGRHGLVYGKSLQARFFGIPLTKKGYYKEKIKDFIAARERFPVFDLSDENMAVYAGRFEHRPFEYINGYTSSLVLFAKYLIGKGIVLKSVCPTLRVCLTTSEVCNEADRETLKKGFGVPIVNEYGAAELDLIAFEDEDFDWIMSNENLLFEILDEQGKPVPDGQEGRIIVTSLYNKAMPFIRYELGDVGAIKPNRKGNNFILQSLQGRINDVAILPSGKRSPGLTFYYISKSLLEGGGFMKEFVIKQKELNLFHYEYVAERELMEEEKRQVVLMMDKYLEPGLRASFERKAAIERTKAGKLRHFQSELGKNT